MNADSRRSSKSSVFIGVNRRLSAANLRVASVAAGASSGRSKMRSQLCAGNECFTAPPMKIRSEPIPQPESPKTFSAADERRFTPIKQEFCSIGVNRR
jgi:hypothetical protein